MAKSGRLELGDNVYGHSRSTQLASKTVEFGGEKRKIRAIMPFKVIQDHRRRYKSKDRMRNFLLVINSILLTPYLVPFRSYRSLLFKFLTQCVFEPPFGGLGTSYDVHLGLIRKRLADFLLVIIVNYIS